MKIGKKLKLIRESNGYSQLSLSKKLSMPQTSISNYENMEEITGLLHYIFLLCDTFSIPAWEFFMEDLNDLKNILPEYIKPQDAALLKLIVMGLDSQTQVELKKAFIQMTKTLLLAKADRLKNLPEYKVLFE